MTKAAPIEQVATDLMDPARAAALHATLALDGDAPGPGDALPPFWHHIYFWVARPPSELGPDGHPAVGHGLVPDMGLPQRMWAGGSVEFLRDLRLGQSATRTSRLVSAERKTGRSGPLAFVALEHDIAQSGRTCLRERQDIVYRGPMAGARPMPVAPADEAHRETRGFDPVLLFRYSALTFNGHRIHYDLSHATANEGYDGLVVHGPLLAQLLMLMAVRLGGPLARFSFRATAPLLHHERADFCARGSQFWVRGPGGRLCMTATAEWPGP